MDEHDYLMMQHREDGDGYAVPGTSGGHHQGGHYDARSQQLAQRATAPYSAGNNNISSRSIRRPAEPNGLVATPVGSKGAAGQFPATTIPNTGTGNHNNNNNTRAGSAAPPVGVVGTQPTGSPARRGGPRDEEDNTWKRLNDIRTTSSREKSILLQRIEQVSHELRQSQSKVQEHQTVLAQYHSVFGPLHEFTTSQVRMREEIVSLHSSVRHWQEKETDAKNQVKNLEKVIAGLQRSSGHDSAEVKLADLQNRLSNAHLQRESVLAEMEAVNKLVEQQNLQTNTYSNDQLLEQHQWRYRGKLAEMKLTLKAKDTMVQSLTAAIAELEKVMKQSPDSAKGIGEVNRRCVSCKKPSWTTPFCPLTGHRHLGFSEDAVEKALASGEWVKLVHAATHEVSYSHVATGKVVEDLEKELKSKQQTNQENEGGVDPKAVALAANGGVNVKPSSSGEIEKLLTQLRDKTLECNKLKVLLRTISETGMVGNKNAAQGAPNSGIYGLPDGVSPTSANAQQLASQEAQGGANPSPGAALGGQHLSPAHAQAAAVTELANAASSRALTVPLYNEDDGEHETKVNRLSTENSYLNKRCGELILQIAGGNDTIRQLQETIKAQLPEPRSSLEFQLKDELAALKDDYLKEQRRCLAYEDQIRALNRRH